MADDQPKSQSVTMDYTYVSAWKVIGGINLAKDDNTRVLYEDRDSRFTLTTMPDAHLEKVDRGSIAANLMLRGLFNAEKFPDPLAEIDRGLEERRKARQSKGSPPTVLVIECFGQCPAVFQHSKELPGLVLAVDAIDGAPIREAHKERIETIKAALGFESEPPSRFEKVTDGIYLTDTEGRTVYSLTFQMNARAYVSSRLTDEAAGRITQRYAALGRHSELASVKRPYAQMAENDDDPLRAFLFGWSALEIFVAKAFIAYEERFISSLLAGSQAGLRGRFLKRVRDVMKDKYRLTEKFTCVAAVLFADAPEVDLQKDLATFEHLKKMRDAILHGEAFDERALPIHKLSGLLRRYVVAYLGQAATSDAGRR